MSERLRHIVAGWLLLAFLGGSAPAIHCHEAAEADNSCHSGRKFCYHPKAAAEMCLLCLTGAGHHSFTASVGCVLRLVVYEYILQRVRFYGSHRSIRDFDAAVLLRGPPAAV